VPPRGIPWVLYAASLSQALPLLAAFRYGRKLPAARKWVVLWCAAMLASDAAQLVLRGSDGTHNLWVEYIVVPLHSAIMLWTLSLWQMDPVSRLAFRVAIPLHLLALAALIPAAESAAAFNQFTRPFQSLVLMAASLYTLVRRASAEPERVTSRDWFWITLGTSMFFAIRVALAPFVAIMLGTNTQLTRLAYLVSAWIDIAALVLIARGMVCPLPQTRSGGSS
jgi:hypothetical protein